MIADFAMDDRWIAVCLIGKVLVLDRATREVKYEIPGKDEKLTFDSPFFMNGKLYFRYSMEQILSLDLSTGEVAEVTESRTVTSKIFKSEGYLGFSYMKAVDPENEGRVEFNIIEEH